MRIGSRRRSQRKTGARPARSLEHQTRGANDEQEPSGQEQARRGSPHGSRAIGESGPVEDGRTQEDTDDGQEQNAAGASLRSGRLRPDELHRRSREGRSRQPEGRASLAFGVKSRTPTSEAFTEREIFASASAVNDGIVFDSAG